MDDVWARARASVALANAAAPEAGRAAHRAALHDAMQAVVGRCRAERKRKRDAQTERDLSDARLGELALYTDALPLRDYDRLLHIVPRLVNVVTVRAFLKPTRAAGDARVLCAARGGHPARRHGPEAAARPAPHRQPLLERLLRAAALRGGAAGVRLAAVPRAGLSCAYAFRTFRYRL